MLDRLDDLKKMSKEQYNLNLTESINTDDEEAPNNDRELIQEFLEHTKDVQKQLSEMEKNN